MSSSNINSKISIKNISNNSKENNVNSNGVDNSTNSKQKQASNNNSISNTITMTVAKQTTSRVVTSAARPGRQHLLSEMVSMVRKIDQYLLN